MENEILELIPSFSKTIFNNSTKTLTKNLGEIAIDSLINNETVRKLPIVNLVVACGNTVLAIRERHLVKKTLVFTQKLHDGTISEEEIEKHKEELDNNYEKLIKEMETIIILIDRHIETLKTKILANFYIAYIDEKQEFSWDDFCIFAEALDNISINDLESLKTISAKDYIGEKEEYDGLALSRLNSQHLVEYFNGMLVGQYNSTNKEPIIAKATSFGKIFSKLGLKNI